MARRVSRTKSKAKPLKPQKRAGYSTLKISLIGIAIVLLGLFYWVFLAPNIHLRSKNLGVYVNVTGINSLADTLERKGVLRSSFTLKVFCKLLDISESRKGLFQVKKSWNNCQLVYHLCKDSLRPSVKVKLEEFRSRANALKPVLKAAYPNKKEFSALLKDSLALRESFSSIDQESVYCLFVPNTFWVYERSSPQELLDAIFSEYQLFWNETRLEKAAEIGRTPEEIVILASIVYSETKNFEEMPLIAGTYINRLKKNMRLESDPTLLFANNKFGARRVNFKLAEINSPYNTYRFSGLPPGPICIPPRAAIDAVLNYERHDFLFFCASDNRSGCHTFSETFDQHKLNANRYRKYLNKRKIY
ncbi:MAG TPA: endolytic transglycosylase MltG [Cytophagaceae bacterium]|jgi:UPF0755 protein